MHPLLIALPILALVFGPRWWAGRLLRRFDLDEHELPDGAGSLARQLLDQHGLMQVDVQVTDVGDHYDPVAKAVRIGRAHFERRSLTAITTAAHEVGHALQDADGYWPFRLRGQLAQVARMTGNAGGFLLLAVPAAALAGRNPLPPLVVAGTATAMLGTSLAAQLAALPSELDASFDRALPMLEGCGLDDQQINDARRILLACSLTYVASSVTSMLTFWPWIGRPPTPGMPRPLATGLGIGLRARAPRQLLPAWPQTPPSARGQRTRLSRLRLPPLPGDPSNALDEARQSVRVRLRRDPMACLLLPVVRPLAQVLIRARVDGRKRCGNGD